MKKFYSMTKHTIESLSYWGGMAGAAVLLFVVLLVTYDVIARFFFHRPTPFASQMAAYAVVLISFLGMAYAFSEKAHIRIESITERLPKRIERPLRLITLVLGFVFVSALTWGGFLLVERSLRLGFKSSDMVRVPTFIPQLAIPIGFALLGLRIMVEIGETIGGVLSAKKMPRSISSDLGKNHSDLPTEKDKLIKDL